MDFTSIESIFTGKPVILFKKFLMGMMNESKSRLVVSK
jgi:hypothetical protein